MAPKAKIADIERDYRICNYNDEHHGRPHIHEPIDGDICASTDLEESEADAVMRRYARRHNEFNLKKFLDEVTQWRSESKRP